MTYNLAWVNPHWIKKQCEGRIKAHPNFTRKYFGPPLRLSPNGSHISVIEYLADEMTITIVWN
jgi:hypothetical protein